MQRYDLYVLGKQKTNFLVDHQGELFHNWKPVSKIKSPIKIVIGYSPSALVWLKNNKLEFHQENSVNNLELPNNEKIKDICSVRLVYFVLTECGKLYTLANRSHSVVPQLGNEKSTFQKLLEVKYFTDNNLKVESVELGGWTNYYLCKGGQLYGSGMNDVGQLGIGPHPDSKKPLLIIGDVERVFSGHNSLRFFFTKRNDDKLYASGDNESGLLGYNTKGDSFYNPIIVPTEIKSSEILDLKTNSLISVLITTSGRTFSCGSMGYNGHNKALYKFTEIPQLQSKKCVQLATGQYHVLLLTEDCELYGWGFNGSNKPSTDYKLDKIPKKIEIPLLNRISTNAIKINCGVDTTFIYNSYHITSLKNDFKVFFQNQKFCDAKMGTLEKKIGVHKVFLEKRIGCEIEKINSALKEEEIDNIMEILNWAYFENVTDQNTLDRFFNSLQLSINPKQNTLATCLLNLFKDEDSKDFNILVKIEEEEDDDDENKDDEQFEVIPVHKFILLTRSGLFRDMFENVSENEEMNEVKDYSEKTIESLEILIKFFYTDKIELTADHDPQLVVEELSDAAEYYQLNENSSFNHQLNLIKDKFDLN
ncbi:btk-binding protein-related [Anaeramoeba flamelloides]|uniref:Btk-binding protein-related n=1 Tax=Anaeramoeba flamelloides TaxID=1746091 RepID=A0AAV8A343_9EUKA|nr:btk-binding protein-related [Anaeramoeba flamelloides]